MAALTKKSPAKYFFCRARLLVAGGMPVLLPLAACGPAEPPRGADPAGKGGDTYHIAIPPDGQESGQEASAAPEPPGGGTAAALPAPLPPEFRAAYTAAAQAFGKGDFDGALRKLDEAGRILPGNTTVSNLRGAVYVRQRKLEEAGREFQGIVDKEPDNTIAVFNLGETHFLNKDYAGAREWFARFLQGKGNADNALGQYKVFLCELLSGNRAAADKTLATVTPTTSNPFYYYAHAAAAFHDGRADEGHGYVKSAFGIYPGGLNAAFADSFIELGWLKREEVGSVSAVDAVTLNKLSQEPAPRRDAPGDDRSRIESLLPDFATGNPDDKDKK